jgi:hypothetical protein
VHGKLGPQARVGDDAVSRLQSHLTLQLRSIRRIAAVKIR